MMWGCWFFEIKTISLHHQSYQLMKKIYLLAIAFFICGIAISQTIVIGGQCIATSVTLTYATDVDGKPAYVGSGTVLGMTGTEVSLFWIGAPENVWVIAFDGQPYFQNPCNTSIPPGTSPNICPWTTVPGTTCTGANPLSVSGAVVLPVTLTAFTATATGSNVALQWTTSQESNNRGFTLQRSADGVTWTDLGFVAGVGNSSTSTKYNYTDKLPGTGINFYRLRQQDLDGRTSLSSIVTATIGSNKFFSISDNPGKGIYKLSMASSLEVLQILITDASGKVLLNKRTAAGNQVIDISNQAPGVYWLMVKKGTTQTGLKLIKL